MKTRRILAASTAALLSLGTVAVVASAADVEYDSDWTDLADGVAYKISKSDAKKLEGLTITASQADAGDYSENTAAAVKAISGCGDLKDKVAGNIAAQLAVDTDDDSTADSATAAIFEIAVAPEDDEDYTDRDEFKLAAPIQINITGLAFEANHVYHVDGSKLVEIDTDKLTKKTESGVTTYGIQFTSKSFSPFVVSKDVIKGAVALDDEENPANDDTSKDDTTSSGSNANNGNNSETGIALAIAPVVLAAGAVAVVALKKKH